MQAPPNNRVQAFEANAAGAWFRQDPSGLAPQVPVPLHIDCSLSRQLEASISSGGALLAAPLEVASDSPRGRSPNGRSGLKRVAVRNQPVEGGLDVLRHLLRFDSSGQARLETLLEGARDFGWPKPVEVGDHLMNDILLFAVHWNINWLDIRVYRNRATIQLDSFGVARIAGDEID